MKRLFSVFLVSNLLIASKAIASYSITDNFFIRAHIGAQVWHNNYETLVNVPVAATPEITTIEVQNEKNIGVTAIAGLGVGYGFS